MSKPTLSDLPPRYQAQIAAQLYGTPHPKTVMLHNADLPAAKPARAKPKPTAAPVCRWFALNGLPEPVAEFRFDPTRKWRFDFAWPEQRIALEVEGGIWTGGRHTRGAGFVKDMEKYNRAVVLGWRVLRCAPDDVKTSETAGMVKEILN